MNKNKNKQTIKQQLNEIKKQQAQLVHKYNNRLIATRQDLIDQEHIGNRGLLRINLSQFNKQ